MEISGYKLVMKETPQTCNSKKRSGGGLKDKCGSTSFHHLTLLSLQEARQHFFWRLGKNFYHFPSVLLQKNMAEKVEQNPRTPRTIKCKGQNLTIPEFTIEDLRKHNHMLGSPTSQGGTPKSARWKNCLCSPTTHVGSFRCRHHRTSSFGSGLSRVGSSVGSNLSELENRKVEPSPLNDSVPAQ
ncbi:hypothetical protein FF1_005670 [Malus domestica]